MNQTMTLTGDLTRFVTGALRSEDFILVETMLADGPSTKVDSALVLAVTTLASRDSMTLEDEALAVLRRVCTLDLISRNKLGNLRDRIIALFLSGGSK